LAEHKELHAIWTILTQERKGYSNHPETRRWKGKLKALYLMHEKIVKEIQKRGYQHKSPLKLELATGNDTQSEYVDSIKKQKEILRNKKCGCHI
jgi:hypothetical protein